MKKIWKSSVVVFAVAVAWLVASGAMATMSQQQQDYLYCVAANEYAGYTNLESRKMCCADAGGSWIEVYDEKGNLIDQGCTAANGNDLDDPTFVEPKPAPTATSAPVSDPRVGTTSGTYQEPTATTQPTRGTSSGTASR